MGQSTKKRRNRKTRFSTINPNAAGIDVGSQFHVVAVPNDRDDEPVRTFQSFTGELHRLADWLVSCRIETVAMESTGIYWVPLYEILEAKGIAVVVANARDVKHVPGRKTDVNDAQWLQQLHEYGLLRGSFHPPADIAALRAYVRQRERLLDYAASHIQHMQKALMQMNLQLHHVVSAHTRRSNNRVTSLLRLAAVNVGKTDSALGAFYRRLAVRIGKAKAVTATARKVAVLFYNTLRYGVDYSDPGAAYYEERHRERVLHNLERRAKQFGYTLEPASAVGGVS